MQTVQYVCDATEYRNEIKRLLVTADEEFVPPLSAREGTTQTRGLDDASRESAADVGAAIEPYHDQCMEQELIVSYDEDGLDGFMSFRPGYETPELSGYQPSNYVSTIVVDPAARRRGIARRLYGTILTELPAGIRSPYVTTRTWSTNESHLGLLKELGFENVETIPDDRGAGVDTVYYASEAELHP